MVRHQFRCRALTVFGALLISVLFTLSTAFAAPRDELAARGLAFTADVFVERAGAGDLEAVKLFLTAGMDVNARECCYERRDQVGHNVLGNMRFRGKTALIHAAKYGHIDLVRFLIAQGADVNMGNILGDTALSLAVAWGHKNIVQLLLEHDADVNIPTVQGSTPLMVAARAGRIDMARMLLARGANIDWTPVSNTMSQEGVTALITAAMFGQTDMVRFLLKNGAEVNRRMGFGGDTALDRANTQEMVRLLKAAGGKHARELK